jgi:hypothetical protein
VQRPKKTKADNATHEGQGDVDHEQATKDDDRLGGVKFHEGTFVDEEKDDAGNKANSVAQQPGHVLSEAFRRIRCWGSGRSDRRRLIGTTLGAKSGSSDFLTTRFAEGHEGVPPEDQFGLERNKAAGCTQ